MVTDTVNHYSRDGFVGSGAHVKRPNYGPAYTGIDGSYAPRRIDFFDAASGRQDPSDLPHPLLVGEGVTISASRQSSAMSFSTKNVIADEIHYVVGGTARIKTEFGYLDCGAGDFIVIPRAVGYRITEVSDALDRIVVGTPGELSIDPFPPRGVLNASQAVRLPEIPASADSGMGPYEMLFRHKGGTTSHTYDFDPLDILTVNGPSPVKCFNIDSVRSLDVSEGGMPPPRLINDSTDQTLFFHLGSRRSDRPPIHVNADYDELIVYASGPAPYGAMNNPGQLAWVPKGIPHHGAEEDTPEPYQAWLVETRASLELTEAGEAVSRLMETGIYGVKEA